jgi:hypothetical protein
MKTLTKALVGTVAAGAMAVSAASPAAARDRGNGIDAGDVIAGALIIGGIAAIAAAVSDDDDGDRYDRDYRYDRAGYGGYTNARYGYGNPNQAAQQCVYAAEQNANRISWGGSADVTDIRNVRQTRYGYVVKGRVAVNTMGHGWQRGNATYGRGWNGDYRGWNRNLRGYDSGTFTCKVERGRVVGLDYNGIRGL